MSWAIAGVSMATVMPDALIHVDSHPGVAMCAGSGMHTGPPTQRAVKMSRWRGS